MKLVKKHTSFEELTPTLLNTFIEKILVHEVEVDAEGQKRQKIEIVYNFIGSVELPKEAYHGETGEAIELPKREKEKSRREIPPTYIPLFWCPYHYYTNKYLPLIIRSFHRAF